MSGKSVVVAGAGGNIGSHFTPHLARMPELGRVILCDRDIYKSHNWSNQAVNPDDVSKSKACVQAQRLREIRPNLEVHAIHAPLESLPLGAWRADLIVACLDSRSARQAVNERAWRLGIPWADSGVLGSEWLARVNVYAPAVEAPCLECAWSDEDYRFLEQQYPCGGGAVEPPRNGATSELGALAAAMLAAECRKILDGEMAYAAVGRQVTLNMRWHRLAVTAFRRNSRCRFDHATWRIEPLRCHIRTMRIEDLIAITGNVRLPGQRFIRRLVCSTCCTEKRLFCLEGSLDERRLRCGSCRRMMAAPGFDIVEGLSGDLPAEALTLMLDQAGLRYGDVLQAGDRFLEIARGGVMEGYR